jgi:hypothetical protein
MGCPRSALSPSCILCMKRAIPGRRTAPGVIPAERPRRARTGRSTRVKIPIRREKTVIERAYVLAERLGLPLWCEDEAGPYQMIPHPDSSFQPEGQPACQDHQYIRGKTCKLLTLFRPATGELRTEPVDQSTNAILHPRLKEKVEAILKTCPPAPEGVPEGRRWQDWDPFPAAEQLDRFNPQMPHAALFG